MNTTNITFKSDYRFTDQQCTTVNINAQQQEIRVQYKQQNSRNTLTNGRINNNALVVHVIQKS